MWRRRNIDVARGSVAARKLSSKFHAKFSETFPETFGTKF